MSKGPAWLLEQLPALVREGILDADSAERLRARYATAANGGSVSRVLFATLGAVLVGLGLILLAAHNWGDWSRATRLTASLAPMLVAQVGVFMLLRWPAVAGVWREPVAAFAVLAFALALAMVGQIFHLPGDLDRYLLTCAALALPLVYLLHASLAAALYALALLGAVAADGVPSGHPLAVVAAYALLVPHLLRLWREDAAGARLVLLSTLLIPLLFANVLLSLPNVPRLGLWWLAGFGALLVLLDARLAGARAPLWRRPLAVWGGVAVAVAALFGSFAGIWRGWFWYLTPPQLPETWLLLSALLGVVLWLAVAAARRGHGVAALQALPMLAMALLAGFDTRPWALPLAWLLSAIVLVIGIAMLRDGLRQRQWGVASRGLFLITLLVLLRFLDTDWSFTVRGVVFVLTGMGFIVASLWLRRRIAA